MSVSYECWLPAPGFPDYEVSDQGRVRRATTSTNGRWKKGRLLRPYQNVEHPCVNPMSPRTKKPARVKLAQLIAEAFLGPRPKGHWIYYKDRNTQNLKVENLCYLSRGEHRCRIVTDNKNGVFLSEEEVEYARCRRAGGATLKEIAEELFITPMYVRLLCTGKCRTSAPGPITKGFRADLKLTNDDVQQVISLREKGLTLRAIGDLLGVSESMISLICSGKRRNHSTRKVGVINNVLTKGRDR